jgi:hypothetical protein
MRGSENEEGVDRGDEEKKVSREREKTKRGQRARRSDSSGDRSSAGQTVVHNLANRIREHPEPSKEA